MCFISDLQRFRHGSYFSTSMTDRWSELPRGARGVALYAFEEVFVHKVQHVPSSAFIINTLLKLGEHSLQISACKISCNHDEAVRVF